MRDPYLPEGQTQPRTCGHGSVSDPDCSPSTNPAPGPATGTSKQPILPPCRSAASFSPSPTVLPNLGKSSQTMPSSARSCRTGCCTTTTLSPSDVRRLTSGDR